MNYETFKGYVVGKLEEMFPKTKVIQRKVTKVNCTLDAISLQKNDVLVPNIYLNDMFEMYQSVGIHETMNKIINLLESESPKIDLDVKNNNNIIINLINTAQNAEMLENVPHRNFLDLSIIYRMVFDISNAGLQSCVITNELLRTINMSESDLFDIATKKTRYILPPTTRKMSEVMRELLTIQGAPSEIIEMMCSDMQQTIPLFVISNERGINGATSLIYEDLLKDLAEQLDSDLYILPSSIHEVIVTSTRVGSPEELANMVCEINGNEVPLADRLSNQVYHYDTGLRKLSLATDTPNKRIDGVVE